MNKTKLPDVGVVIPFYQLKEEPLINAVQSIETQTYKGTIYIIVVDDGSPVSAKKILSKLTFQQNHELIIIEQKNGGAGSARNTGLNNIPSNVQFVAFLDSDDSWRSHHLENAIEALLLGYDLYFSDWWSFNYPDQSNFERIQSIKIEDHVPVPEVKDVYELGMTPLEHILRDGGGVIGTPTVVFNFIPFKNLRFREEFYNGQDFFFWIDIGQMGARCIFSTKIGCDCGEGINIYQGAGWGTERSLQRNRNELFVWTSVNRFYDLDQKLKLMNKKTIRNLQQGIIRDIIYRVRRRKSISFKLLQDIISYDVFILLLMPKVIISMIFEKILRNN